MSQSKNSRCFSWRIARTSTGGLTSSIRGLAERARRRWAISSAESTVAYPKRPARIARFEGLGRILVLKGGDRRAAMLAVPLTTACAKANYSVLAPTRRAFETGFQGSWPKYVFPRSTRRARNRRWLRRQGFRPFPVALQACGSWCRHPWRNSLGAVCRRPRARPRRFDPSQ